jgi:ABC-type polysaccharide/polyol phosphate export permease
MQLTQKNGSRTTIEVVDSLPWQQRPGYLLTYLNARWRELWLHRELLRNLVVRDLKVRYKNSVLGVLWSLLNPLLMMIVFTAVFTVMRGQDVRAFPAFVLSGLLPWQFFQNSVSAATGSIVGNGYLINKVYFPREILVISGVLSNLVNFLLALLVLFPIIYLVGISLTFWALLLPLMLFNLVLFTLGISFIVATTNVFYRDVKMIIEVVLLAGFFLTPIFYSINTLPQHYELFGITWDIQRLMYYLNPMASIIENFQRILYHGNQPAFSFVLRTFLTAGLFLIFGLAIFFRYSNRFGEEV